MGHNQIHYGNEGLNFVESVDKLANLAGLEVPKQDPIERGPAEGR